jgi:hypothetical protein
MKKSYLSIPTLALAASMLAAQPVTISLQAPPPRRPDLTGLAIRFNGTLANVSFDNTMTAANNAATDASLTLKVASVSKNGSRYLVKYQAKVNNSQFDAEGSIFLLPGNAVNVVKCATTDLTLTLTELAP